ncbi:MAG: XRE family transcriptional regulator [Chryseobacterium sp.]|nr:MAG: XRE family transcriptional regulator [Chryseobacterium sp.]
MLANVYYCPKCIFQMKLFGETLKELRTTNDLPLRKVAAYLDLDTSVLSKIERGERIPTKETVMKAAEFFSVDEKELLANFYGEQVAKIIFREKNCEEILRAAKTSIEYLKLKFTKQGSLDFEHDE